MLGLEQSATLLAEQLVRMPSETGNEGLAISKFVSGWMESNGIKAQLQYIGPGRANVIGTINGDARGPRLLFNGHLDTKPSSPTGASENPTDARSGLLIGRGACDAKASIAAALAAASGAAKTAFHDNGIILGFEVGEEGGGWGIFSLLDEIGPCEAAIVMEPTGMRVARASRGQIRLSVRVEGRAAHAASGAGIDAVKAMVETLDRLRGLERGNGRIGEADFDLVFEHINGGERQSACVPSLCEAAIDIRLGLPRSVESVLTTLTTCFDDIQAKIDARVNWHVIGHPVEPCKFLGSRVFDRILAHLSDSNYGRDFAQFVFPAWSSAHILTGRNIPAVVVGPGDLACAHTAHEFICTEDIQRAARAYARLMDHFLNDGQ